VRYELKVRQRFDDDDDNSNSDNDSKDCLLVLIDSSMVQRLCLTKIDSTELGNGRTNLNRNRASLERKTGILDEHSLLTCVRFFILLPAGFFGIRAIFVRASRRKCILSDGSTKFSGMRICKLMLILISTERKLRVWTFKKNFHPEDEILSEKKLLMYTFTIRWNSKNIYYSIYI